jgi:hypothetical protein
MLKLLKICLKFMKMKNNILYFKDKVFYVNSFEDKSVLIAIDVFINKDFHLIKWFDGNKQRVMIFENIYFKENGEIEFIRNFNNQKINYYLYPLTLKIYNEKLKNFFKDEIEFKNEEDLIKKFLELRNNSY